VYLLNNSPWKAVDATMEGEKTVSMQFNCLGLEPD
jgi:hypothetical protein